jgi:ComF family protein
MPVPVHPKKLKEREFNQSLLLARPISNRLEGELDFLSLRRIRNTLPQTGLKGVERRRNVLKAFALEGKRPVAGRAVLLVDDVATTGNTLNECARVLKKGGAKEVLCLVLARTAKL